MNLLQAAATATAAPIPPAATSSAPDPYLMVALGAVVTLALWFIQTLYVRNKAHEDKKVDAVEKQAEKHADDVKEGSDTNYTRVWELVNEYNADARATSRRIEDKLDQANKLLNETRTDVARLQVGIKALEGYVDMQQEITRLRGLVRTEQVTPP